jgi:hypothetical protein
VEKVTSVTIAPATWMERDDMFYLIVKYNNGMVRHYARAFGCQACAEKAQQMMLPPALRVTREKVV